MSDESPSPESANPKKETVRISLPKRPSGGPGTPVPIKRETVRINIPKRSPVGIPAASFSKGAGDTKPILPSTPVVPKMPVIPSQQAPAPALVAAMPTAPKPPVAPVMPMPPAASALPVAASAAPPKAPTLPAAPKPPAAPSVGVAVPKPSSPVTPKPAAPAEVGIPIAAKPASPKKETARIQLPLDTKAMPKATVKMQETVPIADRPGVKAATTTTAPIVAAAPEVRDGSGELPLPLAAAAVVLSAAVFGIQLWTYLV